MKMIQYDDLNTQITERDAETMRNISGHYRDGVEREFEAAVESGASFPIVFKVSIHGSDVDKKGAVVIRNFLEEFGYRSVRTSYDNAGSIKVEVYKNGTSLQRTPHR